LLKSKGIGIFLWLYNPMTNVSTSFNHTSNIFLYVVGSPDFGSKVSPCIPWITHQGWCHDLFQSIHNSKNNEHSVRIVSRKTHAEFIIFEK
jgi:hypothetical protein